MKSEKECADLESEYQEAVARAEIHRLDTKYVRLQCRVESLYDAIKHGDDEHKRWLRDKIKEHFADVSWPSLEHRLL